MTRKFVQVSEGGARKFIAVDEIAALAAGSGGANTRVVLASGTQFIISVDFKDFVKALRAEGDCVFFSGGGPDA